MKSMILIKGPVFVLTILIMLGCWGSCTAQSAEIHTNGRVCANPSSPCGKGFDISSLSFKLPAKLT